MSKLDTTCCKCAFVSLLQHSYQVRSLVSSPKLHPSFVIVGLPNEKGYTLLFDSYFTLSVHDSYIKEGLLHPVISYRLLPTPCHNNLFTDNSPAVSVEHIHLTLFATLRVCTKRMLKYSERKTYHIKNTDRRRKGDPKAPSGVCTD